MQKGPRIAPRAAANFKQIAGLTLHRRQAAFEAQSREVMNAYPRYRDWITGSFLRQGDHANVVEYFADIPTNFRDVAELPPAIATHFAPLISGGPFSPDFDRDLIAEPYDLAAFQRSLSP